MTVRVGGVSIGLGLEGTNLIKGIEQSQTALMQFQRKINNIKLEAVIKGDPFSATKKYVQAAGKELDHVFKQFSQYIQYNTKSFDRFAEASNRSARSVIKDWDNVKKNLAKAGSVSNILGGQSPLRKFVSDYSQQVRDIEHTEKITGVKSRAYQAAIRHTKATGDPSTQNEVSTINANAQQAGENLRVEIQKKIPKLLSEFKGLSKGLDSQINAMVSSIGRGEDQTSQAMLGLLNKLANTITLKKPTLEKEYQDLTQSAIQFGNRLRQSYLFQGGMSFRSDVATEGNAINARRLRAEASRKLTLEEARLNAQIKIGMNIETNKIALLENSRRKMELYGKDTRKVREEIAKLHKQMSVTTSDDGFLGKNWFYNRAKWFLQLRGYWAIYRSMASGVKDLAEFHEQLARAMRTANSEFMNTVEITKRYKYAMAEARGMHGADYKTIGESLYQLTSAGLSSEEALSALNKTLSLTIGLEGDARDTTKMVAAVYNNFSDELQKVGTVEQQFAYITDMIAGAWQRNQMELSEFNSALSYSAAISKIAGVSFKELTGILAVTHSHLLRGSKAGTGFVNVLMRISREPMKFKEAFQIPDEVLDPTKPLKILEVLRYLSKEMQNGTRSSFSLAQSFERMGLRGAPQFETMLAYIKEIDKEIVNLGKDSGKTEKIEMDRLKNLTGAWNKFTGTLSRFIVTEFSGLFDILTKAFDKLTESMNKALKEDKIKEFTTAYVQRNESVMNTIAQSLTQEEFSTVLSDIYEKQNSKQASLYADRLKLLWNLVDRYKKNKLSEPAPKTQIPVANEDVGGEDQKDLTNYGAKLAWRSTSGYDKISKLNTDISRSKSDISKRQSLINRLEKDKGLIAKQNLMSVQKLQDEAYDKLDKLESERKSTIGEILRELDEEQKMEKNISDHVIKSIESEIKLLELKKSGIELTQKELKLEGITEAELEKALVINEELYKIAEEIAWQKLYIAENTADANLFMAHEIKQQEILTALIEKQTKDEAIRAARRATIKKEETAAAKALKEQLNIQKRLMEEKELIAEKDLITAENENKPLGERLALEKKVLDIRLQEQRIQYQLVKDTKVESQRSLNQIAKTEGEILKLQEQITREANIWYDLMRKIEEKAGTSRDLYRQILEVGSDTLISGVSSIGYNATGGFQEQRQEVANLEGELKNLEIAYQEALAEGNIDKARQLSQEMGDLRGKISDLKNPLKQLGESFKDLFKDVIDGIRKVIVEWLVMKAVTGILKAATSSASQTYTTNESLGYGMSSIGSNANGGIVSNIRAFRKFSQGGLTGGPTAAILGDNKSGRELIIPTENIETNKVSGYMKDKENIYIANFITNEDLMSGLASAQGGKIVVNHVMRSRKENARAWQKVG